MFSLKQIKDLFHLNLRRSNVAKRLTKNDEENADLLKRVKTLEQWRQDFVISGDLKYDETNKRLEALV